MSGGIPPTGGLGSNYYDRELIKRGVDGVEGRILEDAIVQGRLDRSFYAKPKSPLASIPSIGDGKCKMHKINILTDYIGTNRGLARRVWPLPGKIDRTM